MNLETVSSEEKQTALIVSQLKHPLVTALKTELERYGVQVYFSPRAPASLSRFDICFFVNAPDHLRKNKATSRKLIYLFIHKKSPFGPHHTSDRPGVHPKIIEVTGDVASRKDAEHLLWFALSGSYEAHLRLDLPKKEKNGVPSFKNGRFRIRLGFKKVLLLGILFVLFAHVVFVIPLGVSSFMHLRAAQTMIRGNTEKSLEYVASGKTFLEVSRRLYEPFRPTYLFFSLAIHTDGLFEINDMVAFTVTKTASAMSNIQTIASLLLKRDKSLEETSVVRRKFEEVEGQLADLEDAVSVLNQKIPSSFASTAALKSRLSEVSDSLSKAQSVLPLVASALGSLTDQKYLILFANNMELRPGGGFIGSFAILHLSNYTIGDFEVYDVYDADGQLTAHVEPPAPIRTYLNQPHFFLRDSAFYPDFATSFNQATFFLEKEMGLTDFAGGALITTSSVEMMLEAFGEVYLPDYKERVNAKNFYLKAQIYSEKDFFPGSLQKKSFLASLMRQIMIRLDTVSPRALAQALKKAADEKQIVLFFNDSKLEELANAYYWSGRVIEPRCSAPIDNCIVDYVFPLDANLGVNKANFFVTRSFDLTIKIDPQGGLKHTLTALYKNDSPGDVFPGGTYKNYFQLMMPVDTIVDSISKNGVTVEEYDDIQLTYHTVGFYMEVPPRGLTEIKIVYHTEHPFQNGKGVLQLIAQKQIGAKNTDFGLTIELPPTMYLLNQNFTPLVKGNTIIYNTVLSTDKIFFVELTKE